ncbi:Ribosomal 50S subunit-recycling heat shock protein, contains S4 domain [Peptoclostridium litorale DSM 5388]|uniref:RQC P-site tRNA stabilizing factor n=1 Tax=Peptoclostridium litorale DSM 5388 TaxID=1121324 RepID=A0A069RCB4_PEPLI|nr:RNA-binding S4 domain-containing protein [Peptoclostridium litorale]KDR94684.1 S4 domain-containing protein [Peptoclostridium litorale DSM 5388]SIO32585.1 Ribosomal 50S subunit-recycling heat shock protein, contains S4 domain [Peptoclostridium litorale DSM 5388]
MRLDKFLKVSRLIKRRTVAKEACTSGIISINGKVAKASTEVNAGDTIEIRFGEKISKVKVLEVREHVLKKEAQEMYEVIQ